MSRDHGNLIRKRPNTSVSFDPELFEVLDKIASETKEKKSSLICRLLRESSEVQAALADKEKVAKACHQIWVAMQEINGDIEIDRPLEDLSEKNKKTAIWGVEYVLAHPDTGPEELFYAWKKHKLEEGWEFGEARDMENKTHPYIIEEFNSLPEEERKNYRLFIKTVEILK